VEAGERSGALLTVRCALEQDREVFCVPGSIFSPVSRGTNTLIQEGAKLVLNHEDILEELNLKVVAHQIEMRGFAQPEDDTESLLLNHVNHEPIHIDDIRRHTQLPINVVSSTLAMMELKGLIKQVGSMHYIRIREALV
jgi:DNA processing protein